MNRRMKLDCVKIGIEMEIEDGGISDPDPFIVTGSFWSHRSRSSWILFVLPEQFLTVSSPTKLHNTNKQ